MLARLRGGHGSHGPRPLSHRVLERGFWNCALPMSSALLASMSEFRRLLEKGEGSTLDWDIYSLEAFSLLSHRVWDCRAGVWDSPLRCRVLVSHLLPGKYQIETCAASSIRVHCWCLPTPSAVNYSTAKDQTREALTSSSPPLGFTKTANLCYTEPI